MAHLLEVKNLKTQFHTHDGIVHAVNGISYTLDQGETLAIVGESGCGKSVGVLSILRLIPEPPGKITEGEVIYNGQDILKISKEDIRKIRGNKISMIFQDPMTSLNPVLTIKTQITESLKLHLGLSQGLAINRAIELLEMVGIPKAKDRINDYPFQFSGGMRQRVMIAMGLSCNPEILIADEPTTALDVTIQAQIVQLVKKLSENLGMSVIWITHDLGVVAGFAQKVNVMYGGYIVEKGLVDHIYDEPKHPYTKGLLGSLPRVDDENRKRLKSIPGTPPDLLKPPAGCPFYKRCESRMEKCQSSNPVLERVSENHEVACWAID